MPATFLRCVALLHFGALYASAQGPGTAGCPCIEGGDIQMKYKDADPTKMTVSIGGANYLYPIGYGFDKCFEHDAQLAPFCADAGGGELAGAPSWCYQQFCYVDKNNCDGSYEQSHYFTDDPLYYSYSACGSPNSFASFISSPLATKSLNDLKAKMENYVQSTAIAAELAHQAGGTQCQTKVTSPCTSCAYNAAWKAEINPHYSATLWRCGDATQCCDAAACERAECVAQGMGETFSRIAALEYTAEADRVAYQYFGSQDVGMYTGWPAMEWCSSSFDPRFRPWYASAASGPKDVVIVIDMSGSMGTGKRVQMAKDAAKKVLATLAWTDYVGIVSFDARTVAYSSALVQVTPAAQASMERWIDALRPGTTTNFIGAFAKAFEVLDYSAAASSGCTKAILFMSDGTPDDWAEADYTTLETEAAALGGVRIFTYALGSGADASITDQIALRNGGLSQSVSDDGDLAGAMASYFELFAAGLQSCTVRWIEYEDVATRARLLAACLPVFELAGGESTCDGGGGASQWSKLLGVSCVDMNVMVDLPTLKAHAQYPQFKEAYEAATKTCPSIQVSDGVRADMQARIDQAGASCSRGQPGRDKCPAGAACKAPSHAGGFGGYPDKASGARQAGPMAALALVAAAAWA